MRHLMVVIVVYMMLHVILLPAALIVHSIASLNHVNGQSDSIVDLALIVLPPELPHIY